MASSYDRTGGNSDGLLYSYLYRDGDEYVLLEAEGSGCLTRIWFDYMARFPGFGKELRFYLSNSGSPTLVMRFAEVFNGDFSPFLFPLSVGPRLSSGGYISYTPLPFEGRVKVTATFRPVYYQIGYMLYRGTDSEQHKVPLDDVEYVKAAETVKAQSFNTGKEGPSYTAVIEPGTEVRLLQHEGTGILKSFTVKSAHLEDLIIKGYWNGATAPQFTLPLGEFFYVGGARDVMSFYVKRRTHTFSFSMPVPFQKGLGLAVKNTGDYAVAVTVEGQMEERDDALEMPLLHSVVMPLRRTGAGKMFVLTDVKGRGFFAGTVLRMEGETETFAECREAMGVNSELCFLEGDEYFYVDGSTQPSLQGTGTEDYFNAGYYFMFGSFSLPFHGLIELGLTDTGHARVIAYRFHLSDPVPFSHSLRVELEVGPLDDVHGKYSSISFVYLNSP